MFILYIHINGLALDILRNSNTILLFARGESEKACSPYPGQYRFFLEQYCDSARIKTELYYEYKICLFLSCKVNIFGNIGNLTLLKAVDFSSQKRYNG